MAKSWEMIIWETILVLTVIGLLIAVVFILNLPHPYNPYRAELIKEENFSEEDKKKTAESGYGYFTKHRGTNKFLKPETSVTVLVLGDIGRSPRMQYHVASIAKHGGTVSLIGYVESELLPEISQSRFVKVIPLKPVPERLRTSSTLSFPFVAPLKAIFQLWSIWRACGFQTKPTKWMLVQNPPSIPTLVIAQVICFFRNTKLIIDWHNFGYTILALKLGEKHPLVKVSEIYEQYVARWADAHFCVTNAMARILKQKYGVNALPLHDRPAKQFQPLTSAQRSEVLHRLEGTKAHAKQIENKEWRLIVSSTSWTADEDFSLLLEAFVAYSATVSMNRRYPKILAIITGKGPHKEYYLKQIQKLQEKKRLSNILIKTAWLSLEDYASLLGAADVGISLHKSSSGVDLPMKVVDMFGAGLPVFGYSKFEAWPELVQDGINGMGFEKAEELETLFEKAFTGNGGRLDKLRAGAEKETKRRWDDEWFPVAGKLFGMSGTTLESEPAPQSEEKPLQYSFAKKESEAPVQKVEQPSSIQEAEQPSPIQKVEQPSPVREIEQPLVQTEAREESSHPHTNITSETTRLEDQPLEGPAPVESSKPTDREAAPVRNETEQDAVPRPTIENALGEGEHVNEGFVDVVNATPLSEVREESLYPVSSEAREESLYPVSSEAREEPLYTVSTEAKEGHLHTVSSNSSQDPMFPRTSESIPENKFGGTYLSYAPMKQ